MTTPALRIAPTAPKAYGSLAGRYEQRTGAFRYWRELLVRTLPARRGDTVLDVGCGTGLCLPLLRRKVGASGMIVGIERVNAVQVSAAVSD
jgi:demethylmenaquinone methyltransferase/2-methoxy-6-polyprenyl-1,4-benzoquinol methylase